MASERWADGAVRWLRPFLLALILLVLAISGLVALRSVAFPRQFTATYGIIPLLGTWLPWSLAICLATIAAWLITATATWLATAGKGQGSERLPGLLPMIAAATFLVAAVVVNPTSPWNQGQLAVAAAIAVLVIWLPASRSNRSSTRHEDGSAT